VEPTSPRLSPVGSRESLQPKAGASPSATATSQPHLSTTLGMDEAETAPNANEPTGGSAVTPHAPAPTSSDEPTSDPSETPAATDEGHGDQHDEDDEDEPGLLPVLPAPGSQGHS
jgi:hypothetical protein